MIEEQELSRERRAANAETFDRMGERPSDPSYKRQLSEIEQERAAMEQMRFREFRTTCLHMAVQTFGVEFGGYDSPPTAQAIVARASEFERFVLNGSL